MGDIEPGTRDDLASDVGRVRVPARGRRKRKRRVRSPHPGVVLIPPEPGHPTWRARFRDPDTGRLRKERLDPDVLGSAEARREWAIKKSRALGKRTMDIAAGAPRATGTALSAALAKYFEANTRLRPGTLELYRSVSDKLEAWAARAGIRSADDLTRAKLVDFRSLILNEKRRVHSAGTKRTELRETDELRSAHTINGELRKVGTILGHLIERDLLPRLTRDDLRRALTKVQATHERVEYLRPNELRALFEAALRHDAATYTATREEHAGERQAGTTLRYEPIAPFLALTLLTGMRFGEALALAWKAIDLEALDDDGNRVGEIHLEGATNKTHRARSVDLGVSPALRTMLAAMRLQSGGKGYVFTLTEGGANAAAKRLLTEYGAPETFGWQALRRTCGTYLTNAPGIFAGASAYKSAKQLGHSVQVAERHYLGLVRGISRDARTLEAAMQIEEPLQRVIARVGGDHRGRLAVVGGAG